MEDHNDLFAKIKHEPMDQDDYPEVIQELVVDGYEVNPNEMNELEVEPSNLGILGNIMKAYDQLSNESNTPGQVEFVVGDLQYSYVVTVKRFDKTQSTDKINMESTTLHSISQNSGVHQDTAKENSQQLSIVSPKKIIAPLSKDEILSDDENIILEHVDDFDDTEVIEEFENDSFSENDEIIFEDEEEQEYVPDDDEELMNQLDNELSHNDNDGNSSNIPSDSEMSDCPDSRESSITDSSVAGVKSDERSVFKCKQCHFMTAREDRLTAHITVKHRGESMKNNLIKNKPPDVDKKQTALKKERNETENKPVNKKGVKTKRVRKRDKALKEFIELLNNGTKMIQPFCNKSKDKSDSKDKNDESNELHKCSFCSFSCSNRTELYRHIGLLHAHNPNEHYKKGKLRTDCVFCPFKGINRKSLLLHLRTKHRGGKGYQCNQCNYKTHHKSNFDRHVEVVHDKKRDVKCPECDFLTTRNYLLEKHIMYKHKGIKPYRCPEPGCDFGSTSSSNRKAHIMEVHKGLKPHVCTVESCNFATSRRFILKSHLYKDHGIGDPPIVGVTKTNKDGEESKVMFQCPHCPHKSAQRGNLHKHIRVKHLGHFKRYKCADCDYSASEKCFVKIHISEVHLGQFPYSCHLCKFKCSIKQRFDRHFSAVHMGQRPYHCEFCDYKASQPVHLQRHIEVIHRGEKPHFCIYCKFNTAHRANLRAHLKSIHRISDLDLKEVLLSCVDLRVKKKRGARNVINEGNNVSEDLGTMLEQGYQVQEEVVCVPETANTIIELKADVVAEQSHEEATIVTVPAIVTVPSIPHNNIDNVDDLEALEASLVLENIGQHQSLAIADSTVVTQSQTSSCSKPIQAIIRRQVTPNTRRIFITKQQNKKVISQEIPKQIHVINATINHDYSR